MTLAAAISGDPHAAAPLVLLHGFGAGAFVWTGVVSALQGAVATIAYDLPGHGGSLLADGIGGAGRMAKAILADLDDRGIGHFHLAGHSMGGAIAALLALRQPQRVLSLALLAPGGFGPQINHRALHHYAIADTEEQLSRALEPLLGFNGGFPAEGRARMLEQRRHPDAVAALLAILETMFVDARATARRQGCLPVAQLGGLPMPIRLLWGDEDSILPVAQSEGLPGTVRVQRLAGAGHMIVEERPGETLAAILANLRDAVPDIPDAP